MDVTGLLRTGTPAVIISPRFRLNLDVVLLRAVT